MMTKKQLRWILCVYCIIVAGSFTVGYLTESMAPENIPRLAPGWLISFPLMAMVICALMLFAGLAGLIGMFCCWGPSRYLFLAGVMSQIFLLPLFALWTVYTGWQEMFGELELLLDGVILTLCFWGPAKHLFEKRKVDSSQDGI